MLVLHFGSLGDCVLAIHAADAVRSAGQATSVTLAARSSIARWTAARGIIGRGIPIDALSISIFGANPSFPAPEVDRPARVISFLGDADDERSGRLHARFGTSVYTVDPRIREETVRAGRHIVQQWLADLASQGCAADDGRLGRLQLAPDQRKRIRRSLRERGLWTGSPAIVIHPGSGGLHKCLPIEAHETLAGALKAAGAGVAWMIGPDEVERFGNTLTERLQRTAPVLFEEDPGTAADIVAGADAFVGYDAGMTHVAALSGVPTFALFAATDPRIWGAIGVHVQTFVVSRDADFRAWAEEFVGRVLGDLDG
jgi:heptosyltransferase-3